jgi:hypothetical protein
VSKAFAAAVTGLVSAAVLVSGCSRKPPGPIEIRLESPEAIVVSGLSSEETDALATVTPEALRSVLRVSVAGAADPMAGSIDVLDGRLEFKPAFPLDAGREYEVAFDGAAMPIPRTDAVARQSVSLPAPDRTPVTRVTAVYPTAERWPANLLRAYVVFSGPMSGDSGFPHITLVDESGAEVKDAFLPVEADFWNADHTRYTVFFDPGRVKRGILPNREQGRALVAGKRYSLRIDAAWRDAAGRPLAAPFEHAFSAGPAVEEALSVDDWSLTAPAAGQRQPLAVVFPWPIDRGLAERSLIVVNRAGDPVAGKAEMTEGDRDWLFTPANPWKAGEYRLTAFPILEDPSGNQVGRPFEVDMRQEPASPDVPRTRIFHVLGGSD